MEKEEILRFILHCTSQEEGNGASSLTKTLSFPSLPTTVAEVKARIEKECQIPEPLQSILFGSVTLEPRTELKSLRLRSDDTLTVRYHSTAECKELDEGIAWIQYLLETFQTLGVPLRYSIQQHDDTIFEALESVREEDNFMTRLAFDYSLPWLEPRVSANKVYFIQKEGLEKLLELHSCLVSCQWHALPIELQLLQGQILMVIWNLAETFQLRREILKRGGLEKCIQSLVQVRIVPELLEEDDKDDMVTLWECIRSSVGALANLCELPETHMTLATNRGAIDQLMSIATTKTFDLKSIQAVAVLLLVLSYTSETHPYLIQSKVVESMTNLSYLSEEEFYFIGYVEEIQPILMDYHRATFFAHLFLSSTDLLSVEQILLIKDCISQFLAMATTQELIEAELKEHYIWETFVPYVRLFYQPPIPTSSTSPILSMLDFAALRRDCLRINLMALQNMLSRENHRAILKRQGLLDYITCLPWHLSGDLVESGRELVRLFQFDSQIYLQPPSLSNMAKAVVAKNYCGLECVLKESVIELYQNIQR